MSVTTVTHFFVLGGALCIAIIGTGTGMADAYVNKVVGDCSRQDVSELSEKCVNEIATKMIVSEEDAAKLKNMFKTLGAIEGSISVWQSSVCSMIPTSALQMKCVYERFKNCSNNSPEFVDPDDVEKAITKFCEEQAKIYKTKNETEVNSCISKRKRDPQACVENMVKDDDDALHDSCRMSRQLRECLNVLNECTDGKAVFMEYSSTFKSPKCNANSFVAASILTLLVAALTGTFLN